MPDQSPYSIFDIVHAGKRMLSPHMARITFSGEQVADMATHAPDQRIKLFFPRADGSLPAIPNRPDWYDIYRAVPPRQRAPMRTYTIRHLRAERCEVDVDFVLHGDGGPASRWAMRAEPGDPIQISAPNRSYGGEVGGYEWKPPSDVKRVLLIADETALPAAAGIVEELAGLPAPPLVDAFIEVPTAADRLELPRWAGLDFRWLVRRGDDGGDAAYGTMMVGAAQASSIPVGATSAVAVALPDVDVDEDVLWDRAASSGNHFYAWVAGETAAVSRIRSLLIKERAVDRRLLNLMGCWRLGKERE
jgi:NADPH-dependent ferric siderophore reductase